MSFINFGQIGSAIQPSRQQNRSLYDPLASNLQYHSSDFSAVATRYALANGNQFVWGSDKWGSKKSKVSK